MNEKPTIIMLHETLTQSYLRDAGTFALALAWVVPGHLIGIPALEWLGAFIFVFMLFRVAMRDGKKIKRLSPVEARVWLDKEFPEEKQP